MCNWPAAVLAAVSWDCARAAPSLWLDRNFFHVLPLRDRNSETVPVAGGPEGYIAHRHTGFYISVNWLQNLCSHAIFLPQGIFCGASHLPCQRAEAPEGSRVRAMQKPVLLAASKTPRMNGHALYVEERIPAAGLHDILLDQLMCCRAHTGSWSDTLCGGFSTCEWDRRAPHTKSKPW